MGADMSGKFAADTSVSVERTRAEIERLIIKYGATSTAFFNGPTEAMIAFEASERRILFRLPLPGREEPRFTTYQRGTTTYQRTAEAAFAQWEQACRQRWRALALVIKAKLEAVESGITTFEDEFMAHIVMPDGQTVATHVKPRIAQAYATETMTPLLPPPGRLS
jgi:hypothetical protein